MVIMIKRIDKISLLAIMLLPLFTMQLSYALDDDKLRKWQSANKIEKNRIENSATINDPTKILKSKKKKKKKRRKKRRKVKAVVSSVADQKNLVVMPKPVSLTNDHKFKVYSDSANLQHNLKWGIPWGTWASATLVRSVYSHDFSAIEIILKQNVVGKFRILPKGTLLSGKHVLNPDTNRLAVHIYRGITPDGKEFKLSASIYDLQKQNGLKGYLITNKNLQTQEALNNGIGQATQDIIRGALAPINPIAGGIAATANALVKQELKQEGGSSRNVIRVDPQEVVIRFDQTL